MNIQNIPIGKLRPDKNQPRQTIDKDRIAEMAQSIVTEGIINPIEVDENLVIVTGEMRWRSAKEAGLKEVPCKVIKISKEERFRRQVIENIHHNTMNDWDTAKALEKLLALVAATSAPNKFNPSTDKGYSNLGRVIGKDGKFIQTYINLLATPKELQQAVKKGEIPYTAASEIFNVPEEFKERIQEKLLSGELRTRDNMRVVIRALKKHPEKAEEILAEDYKGQNYQEVVNSISKAVPSLGRRLKIAYDPVRELNSIHDQLRTWLNQNHPHSLGVLFGSRIIMAFAAMQEGIDEWLLNGKKTNKDELLARLKGK